ncbi:MAG TPA: iron-sulfur cluster assembly protein [Sulfolobales archaeon]|nr:iron-sulfur cluster assembly protein [Sulfolobales archaeon]
MVKFDENKKKEIIEKAIETLKKIYDPEIPINIYDLGLIYGIDVDNEGVVTVTMTLTAMGCPVATELPYFVYENLVSALPEAKEVYVDVVYDPPWNPTKMTEDGRRMFIEIYGYDIVEQWKKRMGQNQ